MNKNIVVKEEKLLNVLFFIMGLTAGMSCIGLYSTSGGITLFTFIQAIVVILGFIGFKISKERIISPYFGIIVCSIISAFMNYLILPAPWKNTAIINLLSNFIGMSSFYLLYSPQTIKKNREYFLRGFKINWKIQIIWCILQFIIGNIYNISLNSSIGLYMAKELPATEISGLTWERAELSFLLIIGYVIFKKDYIFRLFSIFCILITSSRTSLIMLIVAVIIQIYRAVRNSIKSNKFRLSLKSIFVVILVFTLIIVYWGKIYEQIYDVVYRTINYTTDASGYTHFIYYKRLPYLVSNIPILNLLFGFSGGCSGYPLAAYLGKNIISAWTIESTYLDYFFSFGLIGWVLWLWWMIQQIVKSYKNKNSAAGDIFIVCLIGSIFYTVLSNWSLSILIILGEYSQTNTKSIALRVINHKNVNNKQLMVGD